MEREDITMNPVFKKWLLTLLTRLLFIVIIANAIALALLWFLPGEGVDYTKVRSIQPTYHRYRIAVMLEQGKAGARGDRGLISTSPAKKISSLLLTGLYGSKKSGFVVIAMKSSPKKTEVIATGESFGGYTLVGVNADNAVFDRDGRSYTVYMENAGKLPAFSPSEDTSAEESAARISRNDVLGYAKNIERIWQDISIVEVRENDRITGFKVTRIKPDTPLANLGLKRGDIIIKANNKQLKSYADALGIYKEIDTLRALELTVLRNNQEKEIVYEIY